MFFVPSCWEVLYGHLAAQQPELNHFRSYAQLIQYGTKANEVIP
jgi:hypothetical protein